MILFVEVDLMPWFNSHLVMLLDRESSVQVLVCLYSKIIFINEQSESLLFFLFCLVHQQLFFLDNYCNTCGTLKCMYTINVPSDLIYEQSKLFDIV